MILTSKAKYLLSTLLSIKVYKILFLEFLMPPLERSELSKNVCLLKIILSIIDTFLFGQLVLSILKNNAIRQVFK